MKDVKINNIGIIFLFLFISINFLSSQNFNTVQVFNCDSSAGFVTSNLNVSVDNNIYLEGSGSIKIQAAANLTLGGWGSVSFSPTVTNFSVGQVLSFWMYTPDSAGRIKDMELTLVDINNSSATWKFYYKTPLNQWNYYIFWLDKPTSSSGNLNLTNIKSIVLRFQQSEQFNTQFELYIDDIRLYYGYEYGNNKFASISAVCSIDEAQKEKAAQEIVAKEISPWIDISNYITKADLARGFVEVAVSFYGTDNIRWIMIGDNDAGDEKDLRAYCDGVIYELLDTQYKTVSLDSVYPKDDKYVGAMSGSWVVLRFALPKEIQSYYKLYIGAGNFQPTELQVGIKRPYWMTTYYKAEAYVVSPMPGVYANIDLKNTPQKTGWEYDIVRKIYNYVSGEYEVSQGAEIEFDASNSVVHNMNTSIVDYVWDFGDGSAQATGVKVKHTFNNIGEYNVSLTLTTSDGKTFPELPYARKTIAVKVVPTPSDIDLYQNGPNPFDLSVNNPTTIIKYKLSEESEVTIKVYTLTGRIVKTLIDKQTMPAGEWYVTWDGKDENGSLVDSGLYLYSLVTPSKTVIKKMLVIK